MTRAVAALAAVAALLPAAGAAALPTVASINLCTDQLVLRLADASQILTLSWLSADPQESMLAAEAARFPPNYGSAEELLRYDPDVVIAGSFTNAFTRALLRDLGYEVVEVPPAESFAEIEANVRTVSGAIGRAGRGEAEIAAMRSQVERYRRARASSDVRGVVVRPGGFTVEAGSLANDLMTLAGLRNVSAEEGLDRWGSLSVETLVRSAPELLIFTGYRAQDASLANEVFTHPALEALAARVPSAVVPAAQWSCGLPESLASVETMRRAAAVVAGSAEK